MAHPADHPDRHARFDQAYFHRWYADPARRVVTPAEIRRRLQLAVAVAEYHLGRPVRSVLDVGCGEGRWGLALRTLRPAARYVGVDPSRYVVARYGARRGIQLGTFGALAALRLAPRYDLVVCSDVLAYLDDEELRMGLAALAPRVGGIAYLQIYTAEDRKRIEGDTRAFRWRPAAWWRERLRRAGLTPTGAHCFLPKASAREALAMERLER